MVGPLRALIPSRASGYLIKENCSPQWACSQARNWGPTGGWWFMASLNNTMASSYGERLHVARLAGGGECQLKAKNQRARAWWGVSTRAKQTWQGRKLGQGRDGHG